MIIVILFIPKQKKFPGRDFSLRLLQVRSRTSRAGKAPNPRGKAFSLFILEMQRVANIKCCWLAISGKYHIIRSHYTYIVIIKSTFEQFDCPLSHTKKINKHMATEYNIFREILTSQLDHTFLKINAVNKFFLSPLPS